MRDNVAPENDSREGGDEAFVGWRSTVAKMRSYDAARALGGFEDRKSLLEKAADDLARDILARHGLPFPLPDLAP